MTELRQWRILTMCGLATVVETPAYLSKAERLLTEAERADIVDMLATNPSLGLLIKDAPGVLKACAFCLAKLHGLWKILEAEDESR